MNLTKKVLAVIFLITFAFFSYNLLAKNVASCTAKLDCGRGGTISCTGYKSCSVGMGSVTCDNVTAYCNN